MDFLVSLAPLMLALIFLVPAVSSDLRSGRIPNVLCCSAFLAGVLLHLVLSGPGGAGLSFAAGLLLLFAMFPFFAVGWLGAGDVKLFAAVGAIGGTPAMALTILVAIAISGCVLALSLHIWHTVLKDIASRIASSGIFFSFTSSFLTKVPIVVRPPQSGTPGTGSEFPYAVAIMTGTIGALALGASGL